MEQTGWVRGAEWATETAGLVWISSVSAYYPGLAPLINELQAKNVGPFLLSSLFRPQKQLLPLLQNGHPRRSHEGQQGSPLPSMSVTPAEHVPWTFNTDLLCARVPLPVTLALN